jgi:translocation and assembly module TamA
VKLALILTSLIISFSAFSKEKVCKRVFIHEQNIKLTDTEKQLVCGDKEVDAYKDVPAYQASFYLTGFLQDRGYLQPRFETVDHVLHTYVGEKSFVKKIKVISEFEKENKFVKAEIKRLHKGKVLTTSELNSIEAEAHSILRQRGFPCSKVQSEVNAKDGTVTIQLLRMAFFPFGEVPKEKIPGLRKNAFDRFYPYQAEDAFNADMLRLNEKRLTRAQVVSGTYYLENCSADLKTFSMEQRFIVGPPRTIRFGAGASTEVGPMARLKWSNNRSMSMASLLSATLEANMRNQSLNLLADSYVWKKEPRRSVLTEVEFSRDTQYDYDQFVYSIKSQVKWTKDIGNHQQIYTLGPGYETGTYSTADSTDTKTFATGLIYGSMQFTSHMYELFDLHPEEGDTLEASFDYRDPYFGFDEKLLKIDTTFAKLYRIANSGRGTIVGGVRFIGGTTWVREDIALKSLPPAVKFYGGGSDDIRGYLLKTLPKNDGQGALSKIALKWELRRTYFWRESLEAFTFLDTAYFGDQSWELDKQLWYSPGIGLRWLSPIGMVQGYAARALAANPYNDDGNYFYAGFGGVF